MVRYCTKHYDCEGNELCLCPGGENKKEWCPNQRKRCLNKAMYYHNAKRVLRDIDRIDKKCMIKLLSEMNEDNPMYGHIQNMCHLCRDSVKPCVEGFETNNDYNIIIILGISLILLIIYKKLIM